MSRFLNEHIFFNQSRASTRSVQAQCKELYKTCIEELARDPSLKDLTNISSFKYFMLDKFCLQSTLSETDGHRRDWTQLSLLDFLERCPRLNIESLVTVT